MKAKKKKRGGSGHRKGASFERVIAKLIVKAFKHHGIEQRECWRSVMSGGHEMSSGDLTLSDRLAKLFPWSVECKFHKHVIWPNFWMALRYRRPCREQRWLAQAIEGANKRSDLSPLLVVKENHSDIYALYYVEYVDDGDGELTRGELVVAPFHKFLSHVVKRCDRVRK
jgi:hypothetical protein